MANIENNPELRALAEYQPKFEIKIFVPADQVLLAPPEMAIFDPNFNCWRSEGITNVKFDENARSIEFTTEKLGKFAALQDKKLDLPYQEWSLLANEPGCIDFDLKANYTDLKLRVSAETKDIKIIGQVHEEVSGTSLVVADDVATSNLELAQNSNASVNDPNKSTSNLDLLRIGRPFLINESTGDTAVKDLKKTLANKSVYLFPSLEQPCSIKKFPSFENQIYTQMALLLALNVCQFKENLERF